MRSSVNDISLRVTAAVLFAVLILISPCSVRKSVENALNIEHSEVSNKSKAASCDISKVWESAIDESGNIFGAPLTPINYLGYSIPKEDFSSLPSVQREFSVRAIKIPLYILYGQRRDAQAVA